MIEDTLKKIRAAEEAAAASIREAESRAREMKAAFRRKCGEELEKETLALAEKEKSKMGRYEQEAKEAAVKIKEESASLIDNLDKLSGKTAEAASEIAAEYLA